MKKFRKERSILCFRANRLLPILTSALVILPLLCATPADAQSNNAPVGKRLRSATLPNDKSYNFNLGSTFDGIISETASTELYDPFTINNLKRLQDEAQPSWDPAGIDPDLTRHVAQRAFSIQAGRTLINTLRKSDVRHIYYGVVDSFSEFQNVFRFSVKNNGSSLSLGKKARGEKLMEFSVEFNLRQGPDPQLRFGPETRLHYDTRLQAPMLEYGFAF